LFPFTEVTVLLIAHYLKFPFNTELQIFSGTFSVSGAVFMWITSQPHTFCRWSPVSQKH